MSNPNPTVYERREETTNENADPLVVEIFGKSFRHYLYLPVRVSLLFVCEDLIRDIKDPEHPHTLEELNVVREECVSLQPLHSSTTPCCHGAAAGLVGGHMELCSSWLGGA